MSFYNKHNSTKLKHLLVLRVCQERYSRHALQGDVCISQADSSQTSWTELTHSE